MKYPSVTVEFGDVKWYIWMPVLALRLAAIGILVYIAGTILKQACSL